MIGLIGLYDRGMALVAFLRGVNVGGHRTFRPSVVARELRGYDVTNVGAAGTFVVRKRTSLSRLRSALLTTLPFEVEIMLCDGRDLIRLEAEHPYVAEPERRDIVRFVSILSKIPRLRPSMPITLPPEGKWLLRIRAVKGRFVLGEYRRQMSAIGHLGQIDKLFGVSATTRNWNTIMTVLRILKGHGTPLC